LLSTPHYASWEKYFSINYLDRNLFTLGKDLNVNFKHWNKPHLNDTIHYAQLVCYLALYEPESHTGLYWFIHGSPWRIFRITALPLWGTEKCYNLRGQLSKCEYNLVTFLLYMLNLWKLVIHTHGQLYLLEPELFITLHSIPEVYWEQGVDCISHTSSAEAALPSPHLWPRVFLPWRLSIKM
jgi:hypothetical protein